MIRKCRSSIGVLALTTALAAACGGSTPQSPTTASIAAPTNLTNTSVPGSLVHSIKLSLAWTNNASNNDGYVIEYKLGINPPDWSIWDWVSSPTTTVYAKSGDMQGSPTAPFRLRVRAVKFDPNDQHKVLSSSEPSNEVTLTFP